MQGGFLACFYRLSCLNITLSELKFSLASSLIDKFVSKDQTEQMTLKKLGTLPNYFVDITLNNAYPCQHELLSKYFLKKGYTFC